jgi:hypothetical protein
MSGAMSDYLEGQVGAHLFRTAAFTKPTHVYWALYTAAPGETGGGTEVSGGSYARAQLDPLDANYDAPVGGNGQFSNHAGLAFPAPTANWGTVVATAALDASTAGNFLIYGTLTTAKTVNNGDPAPSFGANALVVTFD